MQWLVYWAGRCFFFPAGFIAHPVLRTFESLTSCKIMALSHDETIAFHAACKRCNQCDSHLQRYMQRCRRRVDFYFWNVACNTCKACHTKQFWRCVQRWMQCFIVRQHFKSLRFLFVKHILEYPPKNDRILEYPFVKSPHSYDARTAKEKSLRSLYFAKWFNVF